jgi:RNA polymerase sigma-70 factor, ECF subfamily
MALPADRGGGDERPALTPEIAWNLLEPPGPRRALEAPAPATETDEELFRHYRATHRAADFSELVRRYNRPLRAYLTRYLGNPDLADDLVQDTFLRMLDRSGQYRDDRPVRPWLYAIASHRAVDALRRRARQAGLGRDHLPLHTLAPGPRSGLAVVHSRTPLEPRGHTPVSVLGGDTALLELIPADQPDPCAAVADEEEQLWLRASLDRLPESLRLPVLLAYEGDHSYREIAETLQIPTSTVKSRIHRALVKLREMAIAAHLADTP